jgi:hypothetical protein
MAIHTVVPRGEQASGAGAPSGAPAGAPTGARAAAPSPLASQLSPPFLLPGEHFAGGVAFLVLGMLGLVWVSPDLAAGRFLTPGAVAVTHLFTLGWITLSIFGALYQFLPVALGTPIRSVPLAHVTFGLFVSGLPAFSYGLVAGVVWLVIGGATLFGAAVILFCGNLAATLARSTRRDLTWWSLAAAVTYLFLTAVLGLVLATNLPVGYLGGSRWNAVGVHMHLALGGWVLMVVIGVAHRLLPMFLLSHGADERWGQAAGVLVAVGVGCLVLLHHAPPVASQWVPAALIAAGLAAFLVQAASYFRHSVKPTLDPGLRLAGAGLGILAAGLVLGAWSMVAGWTPGTLVGAYGLALILGLSVFVAGHYYKIVPFLVWYHRYGPLVARQPVPRVGDLYSARVAAVAAVLMAVGAGGVVLGVLAGSVEWVRTAALLATGGVAVEAVQMMGLALRRP